MTYPQMRIDMPWSLVKGGFKKTPHYSSLSQKTVTGRRSSVSMMPFATWDFEVDLNYVLGGETIQGSVVQDFLSCFMQTHGAAGFFLFTDPNDNTVSDAEGILLNVTPGCSAPLGQVGDGTSTQFQLGRSIGSGLDLLQNVNGYRVYVNGVEDDAYSINQTGVVTFNTAPATGAMLTWDGSFQYLCQFTDDTLKDFGRFSRNVSGFLWSGSSIAFEGVIA